MSAAFPLPAHGWPLFQPGWVWLVGAGPGDPGLLTLHGLNALRQADVVVHDALINSDILGWAPQARHVDMGKRAGKTSARQEEINAHLVALAGQGLRVLRLKGGDPYVFGRGGEEALALAQAGVPFRVVPGITAGIGDLAAAGIPVTHRAHNQAVTFGTGHDQTGASPASLDWAAIAQGSQMLVIYMGLSHAATITARLIAAGRPADEPCAILACHPAQPKAGGNHLGPAAHGAAKQRHHRTGADLPGAQRSAARAIGLAGAGPPHGHGRRIARPAATVNIFKICLASAAPQV